MHFIGIIKLENDRLSFGPFNSYEEADEFIQQKFFEYKTAEYAHVDGLIEPVLFPNRSV